MTGLSGLDNWLTSPPEEPDWLEIAEKYLKREPANEDEGQMHALIEGLLEYLDEAERADHTPLDVWIVVGETGQFEEHCTWIYEKAFVTRREAILTRDEFNNKAKEIWDLEDNGIFELEVGGIAPHPDPHYKTYGSPAHYTVTTLEIQGED